jgi:oxygen-independent coproporphyrinogen-3 oxidase
MSHSEIPLSLYIHIPWCIRKCPYCDFNSHTLKNDLPEQNYIDTLITDAKQHIDRIDNRPIQTIFIGGGTPSLISPAQYVRLFTALSSFYDFSPSIEITLEANPGSAEQQRFKAYRELGINRLSLGIQSFDDKMLKRLGRIHDGQQGRRAIEMAYLAGFDNINIDIMHHLPEQTAALAAQDINTALSFAPKHLSWYQLTIEPNTYFYSNPPPLPNDATDEAIDEVGKTLLAPYHQYEISAYCLADLPSQHNLNYWRFGDYLGIGAGAHGKISHGEVISRTTKKKQPQAYLNDSSASYKILSAEDRLFEFMLNATRLKDPTSFSLFTKRTGLPKEALFGLLEKAKHLSLIDYSSDAFWVTTKGSRFLNDLQALFLTS